MAAVSLSSVLRASLLILLLAAIGVAFVTLPVEKILKDFLVWIGHSVGPWGPLVLAVAYVPLTILAVPASVLTLGGGYLFGLPIGFLADTFGATMGATAAFMLGRTIWRPYVISKLSDYPKFQAIAIATKRSGFKVYPYYISSESGKVSLGQGIGRECRCGRPMRAFINSCYDSNR